VAVTARGELMGGTGIRVALDIMIVITVLTFGIMSWGLIPVRAKFWWRRNPRN
jgi:hypothetical protein